MSKLYVTQRARDDIELVGLSCAKPHGEGMPSFGDIVAEALDLIGQGPTCGKRHVMGNFEAPSGSSEMPGRLLAAGEFWTFALSNLHNAATHRLLYRIVCEEIEVARLLHDSMDVREHIPVEWLIDMMRSDAA